MSGYSPMILQYMEIKEKHKDSLVFFRLGDFYELFFDDARLVSDKLGLNLTSRESGIGKCPMCGVPHHAAEGYILRLVAMGYKVALCDQVGDSKKGEILQRKVVRIYTPGTTINDTNKTNSYISAIIKSENLYGLAYCDVATGDFYTTSFNDDKRLLDELHKIAPKEIITDPFFDLGSNIKEDIGIAPNILNTSSFLYDAAKEKILEHFQAVNLDECGLSDCDSTCICACGALIDYLYETQQSSLLHITKIEVYTITDFMMLDKSTRRNLELTETLREKETAGTLLGVMNKTKTAMGERLLTKWMNNPLMSIPDIKTRQEAVGEYAADPELRKRIRESLAGIADLDKLCGKINYKRIKSADFAVLRKSALAMCKVKGFLGSAKSSLNAYFAKEMDDLNDISNKIASAISMDGNTLIARGYNKALDELREIKDKAGNLINSLEVKEKDTTGIKNLKVGHNRVFGYYIEVPNAYSDSIPESYVRRQTLTNCERYITEELKQLEFELLDSAEKAESLEKELFYAFRSEIALEIPRIQLSSNMIATIDVLQSLGEIAGKYGYVCPKISGNGIIDIEKGRHPVVERLAGEAFVANDTYLNNFEDKTAIITGPNMAGKSTFLRQTALICIMAQMGSFVPADAAKLTICDKVFTRVGASDDLARGQSTFMLEMSEVANILQNATKNSLLILDEIGRGTSTIDGLSIALSVVEYVTKVISAKTLFATHYHELTAAEGKMDGVINYCMQVIHDGDDIVFKRKVIRGSAKASYGIHVAKLAGLPDTVINRSLEIQEKLEMHGVFNKQNDDAESFDKFIPKSDKQKERDAKYNLILKEMKAFDLDEFANMDVIAMVQRAKSLKRSIEEILNE